MHDSSLKPQACSPNSQEKKTNEHQITRLIISLDPSPSIRKTKAKQGGSIRRYLMGILYFIFEGVQMADAAVQITKVVVYAFVVSYVCKIERDGSGPITD